MNKCLVHASSFKSQLLRCFLALAMAVVPLAGCEDWKTRLERDIAEANAEYDELLRENFMTTPEKAIAGVKKALDAWSLGDSSESYGEKENVEAYGWDWTDERLVLLKYEIGAVRPENNKSLDYPISWNVNAILYLRSKEGIDMVKPTRIYVRNDCISIYEISKLD